MIRLVIDNFNGQLDMRVHFTCPYCNRTTWFAANAPYQCDSCFEVLPNMCSMMVDKEERLLYHRKGLTKSIDRYVTRARRFKVPREMTLSGQNEQIRKHMFVG